VQFFPRRNNVLPKMYCLVWKEIAREYHTYIFGLPRCTSVMLPKEERVLPGIACVGFYSFLKNTKC